METINACPWRWGRDEFNGGRKFAEREAAAGRQKEESEEEKTRDAIATSLAFLSPSLVLCECLLSYTVITLTLNLSNAPFPPDSS